MRLASRPIVLHALCHAHMAGSADDINASVVAVVRRSAAAALMRLPRLGQADAGADSGAGGGRGRRLHAGSGVPGAPAGLRPHVCTGNRAVRALKAGYRSHVIVTGLSTGQLHHASLRSAVKQDFVADSCKRAASARHKRKGQSRVQIRMAACACAITAARLKCAALMAGPCRAGEARHDAGDVDRPHRLHPKLLWAGHPSRGARMLHVLTVLLLPCHEDPL